MQSSHNYKTVPECPNEILPSHDLPILSLKGNLTLLFFCTQTHIIVVQKIFFISPFAISIFTHLFFLCIAIHFKNKDIKHHKNHVIDIPISLLMKGHHGVNSIVITETQWLYLTEPIQGMWLIVVDDGVKSSLIYER